eukprot:14039-Rhodomonas_salina.4
MRLQSLLREVREQPEVPMVHFCLPTRRGQVRCVLCDWKAVLDWIGPNLNPTPNTDPRQSKSIQSLGTSQSKLNLIPIPSTAFKQSEAI